MRAPLSWIKEFTPVDASVDEIVAALNQVGLEVETVEEPGREVQGVVAARVLEVMKHPNADKVTLVDVDAGDHQSRVVCGASNVSAGDVVPYAPAGSRIPAMKLERRTIRGVESDGMLCSPHELGLGEDASGILHLDHTVEPGTDVREVLGLDDAIFELSITPNRPDAMCIVGVARELAAHFRLPLDVPVPQAATASDVAADVSVVIESPRRCPRYLGWAAQVTLGDSPAWMARRLVKAGMRPISNVVDVTNYVLLERNQPLHAFDLERLAGPGIVVRVAEPGERITTLDGTERALDPEDLLICDAERLPQAIAGIMGGGSSEVSPATRSILLEAAYFERMGIARSSKRLKLRSESSARFERGIDPNGVAEHATRAMELLADVARARVSPDPTDEYPARQEPARIHVRTRKINAVLGTELSDTEMLDALRPLGIDSEGSGDEVVATVPTFRPDLEREIDLVEEVARRVGFDAIGRTVPKPEGQVGGLSHRQRDRRTVADALVGAGYSEAVTLPLVAAADLERAGALVDRVVEVANPLRAEESVLRTRILPGLLKAAAANGARGLSDVALFETGRVFLAPRPRGLLPEERYHLAAVRTGTVHRRPVEDDRSADAFDTVDALAHVVDALEVAGARIEATAQPGFQPGAAAAVLVGEEEIGVIGEVAHPTLHELALPAPVVALELDLDRLFDARRRDRTFRAPPPYPPSIIDLAFKVPEETAAGDVADTLRDAVGDMLEDVRLFDVFRSDTLGPHEKSLAYALRFRAPDRTLTDAEVGELRQGCIDAVVGRHHGELRG